MMKEHVLQRLQSLGSSKNIDGMKRFGIVTSKAFGATAPQIRLLAKK
ncbi:MAG: hypothetical protein PHP42_05390 [Bacteroidota bacterium]|nr:hypothetical protein [Bacteroidota bacterium]